MWRWLYHDHYLLGAQKDTMPRRKWLKLVGSTAAFSHFKALAEWGAETFRGPLNNIADRSSDGETKWINKRISWNLMR